MSTTINIYIRTKNSSVSSRTKIENHFLTKVQKKKVSNKQMNAKNNKKSAAFSLKLKNLKLQGVCAVQSYSGYCCTYTLTKDVILMLASFPYSSQETIATHV